MEKTRIGAAVRATVDDAEMARGVGIDTSRISMFIFALGTLLAALGEVIGGAFLGVCPGLDFQGTGAAQTSAALTKLACARGREAAHRAAREMGQGFEPSSFCLNPVRDLPNGPIRSGTTSSNPFPSTTEPTANLTFLDQGARTIAGFGNSCRRYGAAMGTVGCCSHHVLAPRSPPTPPKPTFPQPSAASALRNTADASSRPTAAQLVPTMP
jgi:hypothetical protein